MQKLNSNHFLLPKEMLPAYENISIVQFSNDKNINILNIQKAVEFILN